MTWAVCFAACGPVVCESVGLVGVRVGICVVVPGFVLLLGLVLVVVGCGPMTLTLPCTLVMMSDIFAVCMGGSVWLGLSGFWRAFVGSILFTRRIFVTGTLFWGRLACGICQIKRPKINYQPQKYGMS